MSSLELVQIAVLLPDQGFIRPRTFTKTNQYAKNDFGLGKQMTSCFVLILTFLITFFELGLSFKIRFFS